ncbi:hypothetical protein ACFQL7_20830 [Halocatena marina]|uniref:Uncharacterized protein n=1 Tax=Halocatena marina TaxID=2934937 RepID=A0ABD5YTY5_9EURY|nr:hypothetical protein [Halocatena marina]
MTCPFAEGVRINFVKSGIILQPRELDYRCERRFYSFAQAKLPREAAALVGEQVQAFEPVTVSINGQLMDRFYLPKDGVTLNESDGIVNLDDAHKILEQGALTKSFDNVTLKDVVTYIFEQRSDTHHAINQVKFTADAGASTRSSQVTESFSDQIRGNQDVHYPGVNVVEGIANTAGGIADAAYFAFTQDHLYDPAGFDFSDVSPRTALGRVEDEFGVESWVDMDGTLWIGHPESTPINKVDVSPSGLGLRLSEFNVTNDPVDVQRVVVRGATDYRGLGGAFHLEILDTEKIYPVGEAWVPGSSDGRVVTIEEPLRLRKQKSVEEAAKGYLMRHIMTNQSGNIVFNGLASQAKGTLAALSPGDIVGVASTSGNGHCQKKLNGGAFVVRRVHHQLSPQNGWTATVEVGGMPSGIQSNSYIYDATNSQRYSNLEAFKAHN